MCASVYYGRKELELRFINTTEAKKLTSGWARTAEFCDSGKN